jgi:hypothetical protein
MTAATVTGKYPVRAAGQFAPGNALLREPRKLMSIHSKSSVILSAPKLVFL